MDEGSLVPASIMGMINAQLQGIRCGSSEVLGGKSVIIFGDQCQLTLGRALSYRYKVRNGNEHIYTVEELRESTRQKSYGIVGRQVWLRFRSYQLTTVNRFLRTTNGMRCAQITMAWRNGIFVDEHVDWLQSRWIGTRNIDLKDEKWSKAYFVHPRNAVLDKVTPMLQLVEGLASGETVYIWQSVDMYTVSPQTRLTKEDVALISELNFKETTSLKTFVWFRGCKMVFTSNRYKHIQWLYMNECTALDIILHPDEPEPTHQGQIRLLEYHPKLLIVKPAQWSSTAPRDFGLGPGKLGITVEHVEYNIYRKNREEVKITRWGFVDLYYAKGRTDYGAQCETIRAPQAYLTDLTKPVGNLAKGSFLVIVSRAESLDTFALIESLFCNKQQRDAYCKFIQKHIALTDEKKQELVRIENATAQLKEEYPSLVALAERLGVVPENAITFPTYSEVTQQI